jgi:molybdopterin synthase subunit MoaD
VVVEWKLFADLAEVAGTDRPTVETDAETVGEALSALLEAHPALAERVTDDDGDLRAHVNLLREGEPTSLDAPVGPSDELALFPPVSGG